MYKKSEFMTVISTLGVNKTAANKDCLKLRLYFFTFEEYLNGILLIKTKTNDNSIWM